jgi:hypothetical protein
LHLSAQGPDLFFDLLMIFAGRTLALGWSNQFLREQRQNGLKDLLPGWPCPITCKQIKALPPLSDDLINGNSRGIEQAQRLVLQSVGQTDRERERLC